ncbi:hypothetical protein FQN60_013167 [Etheostoma spectabile]|uniref:Uncharacterized protein n=1 Tax=Etheostoma spectabile TaxID=54343 RepID=A0A5J5D527_9PERO|nr:hypothetical protein FQN60_013167 [Etheostoma spectabile]
MKALLLLVLPWLSPANYTDNLGNLHILYSELEEMGGGRGKNGNEVDERLVQRRTAERRRKMRGDKSRLICRKWVYSTRAACRAGSQQSGTDNREDSSVELISHVNGALLGARALGLADQCWLGPRQLYHGTWMCKGASHYGLSADRKRRSQEGECTDSTSELTIATLPNDGPASAAVALLSDEPGLVNPAFDPSMEDNSQSGSTTSLAARSSSKKSECEFVQFRVTLPRSYLTPGDCVFTRVMD